MAPEERMTSSSTPSLLCHVLLDGKAHCSPPFPKLCDSIIFLIYLYVLNIRHL